MKAGSSASVTLLFLRQCENCILEVVALTTVSHANLQVLDIRLVGSHMGIVSYDRTRPLLSARSLAGALAAASAR